MRWEIHFLRQPIRAAAHGLFQGGLEVEILCREGFHERTFHKSDVLRIGNRLEFCVTDAEDIENQVVAPGEDVSAQNVQVCHGERSGDF